MVIAVFEEVMLLPLPGDTTLALELSSSEVDGVKIISVTWVIVGPM